MKKRLNVIFQIILLFAFAIGMSFVADSLHNFFGDFHCNGSGKLINDGTLFGKYNGCNTLDIFGGREHDPTWHWGYRHYIFFLGGVCLFIVQSIYIIDYALKKFK